MDFDLFENTPSGADAWRKRYFEQKEKHPDEVTRWMKNVNQATVQVVLQKEDSNQDRVKAFYDAQRDLARNGLPPQTREGAYNVSGATVQLCEMQLHNMDEFSDQAFKPQTKSKVQVVANKILYKKCGHYQDMRGGIDEEGIPLKDAFSCRERDDYCFACKLAEGSELNPKPDFVNFQKKGDEMTSTPSQAFDLVYPMPFGREQPVSAALKSGIAKNSNMDELQKENTVDWIGDKYLPKQTQDGKKRFTPPQFQLSSAKSASLGCLMAMIPASAVEHFVSFASKYVKPGTLAEDGIEDEPHVTVLYGFRPGFDAQKLEKLLASSGPIPFTVGSIGRFECPDYDVIHFKVNSPELELLNSKLSKAFADEIEEQNRKYAPHVTIAYVKKGTNTHFDGVKVTPKTYGASNLLFSGPKKQHRQFISLSWDGQIYTDLDFQDGIGEKQSSDTKPFENNVGDLLQSFLIQKSKDRKKETQDLDNQLKKPFGHQK